MEAFATRAEALESAESAARWLFSDPHSQDSYTVIGQCLPRHRHQEFLKFLRTIDRAVPKDLTIHLIIDNYATHKHPTVGPWLDKHPRFQLHFTPTSSSWPNLVERWFRELTDKALRRGVFHFVPDLIASIEEYLNAHNDDPPPVRLDRDRRIHPRQSRPRTHSPRKGQLDPRHIASSNQGANVLENCTSGQWLPRKRQRQDLGTLASVGCWGQVHGCGVRRRHVILRWFCGKGWCGRRLLGGGIGGVVVRDLLRASRPR